MDRDDRDHPAVTLLPRAVGKELAFRQRLDDGAERSPQGPRPIRSTTVPPGEALKREQRSKIAHEATIGSRGKAVNPEKGGDRVRGGYERFATTAP
jgi:hypothetical protein